MFARPHAQKLKHHARPLLAETSAAYALAAVLAVLFFFALYPDPIAFLSGSGVYFEIGDAPQHVSGWLLYAKDDWRWPLLTTQLLAPPRGTHIALTDSIPLAALVFKPLFPYLGENFHYFGLWHLFAKILQAGAAVYLIRSLGQKSLLAALATAALALLWPAMLFRLQHTALMTHGVILIALGFYFRSTAARWSTAKLSGRFLCLALASLLIHPYLFAMVFPLYLASAWDRWWPERNWRAFVISIVMTSAGVALPAWLLGYASAGGGGGGEGFETFSMNLLSPFCGGTITLCGLQDATTGQYEGYNTLGLGVLLIVALAAIQTPRPDGDRPRTGRSRSGLIVILIGLTLYSLSGHVYLGHIRLTDFAPPFPLDNLTQIFRAAGRFFWPVSYAVAFVSLARLLHRPRLALIALPIAIGAQWLDTAGLRSDTAHRLTVVRPFDYSAWPSLADRISRVEIAPDHGCDRALDDMWYLYFQIVAGRLGIPVNTGYTARSAANCDEPDTEKWLSPERTLSVDLRPITGGPLPSAVLPRLEDGSCVQWRSWGGLVLCLDTATPADWERLSIR